MTIKKLLKRAFTISLLLSVFFLIYLSIPRVNNPDLESQTELAYGKPVDKKINDILTPIEKPERTRSIVILKNEKIIYEYGPTDKIMNTASIRKSILGLLYGIAVDKGLIDIHLTLAELKIDESTPLTNIEKTATIKHLLMFKSGIYLPSRGEHDSQITDRPIRESYKPGEYFFSNNFDANALGTIFMQETGVSIGKFMEEHLAIPMGLQDFSEQNVIVGDPFFWSKKESKHKQYYIYLSTRDLARIGAMVANEGHWNSKQIVSKKWITESTTSYSNLKENHIDYGRYDGFGYQWWLASNSKSIWSDGYGERFLIINPEKKLTLVEQNFTGNSFLSIGLWLINKNMDSGLGNLTKAHQMITETINK
ncbi:MAG: CubicO group peptidase (beta-lactamase class C family) [Mariniflexile sp.]|jgi:CubicO group peptidase (beta-lactamase class C family)